MRKSHEIEILQGRVDSSIGKIKALSYHFDLAALDPENSDLDTPSGCTDREIMSAAFSAIYAIAQQAEGASEQVDVFLRATRSVAAKTHEGEGDALDQ